MRSRIVFLFVFITFSFGLFGEKSPNSYLKLELLKKVIKKDIINFNAKQNKSIKLRPKIQPNVILPIKNVEKKVSPNEEDIRKPKLLGTVFIGEKRKALFYINDEYFLVKEGEKFLNVKLIKVISEDKVKVEIDSKKFEIEVEDE